MRLLHLRLGPSYDELCVLFFINIFIKDSIYKRIRNVGNLWSKSRRRLCVVLETNDTQTALEARLVRVIILIQPCIVADIDGCLFILVIDTSHAKALEQETATFFKDFFSLCVCTSQVLADNLFKCSIDTTMACLSQRILAPYLGTPRNIVRHHNGPRPGAPHRSIRRIGKKVGR